MMIVSISRRTDIPALYTPWLMNRLREGFVLVPNPRNPHKLSRIQLNPDTVDCMAFWSKNPSPMLAHLQELEDWGVPLYFTFTLTPYGPELEPRIPSKKQLLDTFRQLSDALGPERVDWRYDPIIVDPDHPLSYHLERFAEYCAALAPCTSRCILSFVDDYTYLPRRFSPMQPFQIREIAAGFSRIAAPYGLPLFTCCEEADLSSFGIRHGACIDPLKIQRLLGSPIPFRKDPGQREHCGCIPSVDIGTYDTCTAGCAYCYATHRIQTAFVRAGAHNPASPLLTGWPEEGQEITERSMPSLVYRQLRFD